MNRLILVGNGFDLAHDLETSYCHFITDYLTRAINKFYESNFHEDLLLTIKFQNPDRYFRDKLHPIPADKALETLENLSNNRIYTIQYNSNFFKNSLHNVSSLNWVDLENEYFDQLISCKKNTAFNFKEVEKLNAEFDFMKNEFKAYLSKIQSETQHRNHEVEIYGDLFCENFDEKHIPEADLGGNLRPERLEILNFNYTSTLRRYADYCNGIVQTKINHIHGELNSTTNPIIFGFGDEYDKSYEEFENFKNRHLFKHIKSFGYFKTGRYHELLRFLKQDDFQVSIFGHSCGLSDRTMLRQIFEHPNCKSIKIFYYEKVNGSNDFEEKTNDIYRHFSKKGEMRNKLVPLIFSRPMPKPRLESW